MRDRALVFVLVGQGAEAAKLAERPLEKGRESVLRAIGRDMRTGANTGESKLVAPSRTPGVARAMQRQAWIRVSAESPSCDVPWGIAPPSASTGLTTHHG